MSEDLSGNHRIHPFKIDRASFNGLFRDHYPNLKAYACLFVDNETAEDIVQDLFIYVWENRENITIHTSITSYLFKAVYTRCLNHINRQKMLDLKHRHIEDELKDFEAGFFDPDKNEVIQKLYMRELQNAIDRAVESLPQKCREVFTLSYLMDMKNRDISKFLDISVSTVEKHIAHALKVLRELLKNKIVVLVIALFV
jgi:RNA polymerase sigma-70 factor (ECF subfamily)